MVVVLGEKWRRWVIQDVGVRAERVEVLCNGVFIEEHSKHAMVSAGSPLEMLFLGNLIEREGVSDLLAAIAKLPASLSNWHVTLAGGGDIDRYRSVAAALGLSGRVRFAGWVDEAEVRRLINRADIMVLPSYNEGLPLSILEALGSGTPVICTPVGAIPEFLTDRKSAIFCRVGDPLDLAARITELLMDPCLRQYVADEGRAAFRARFSLQTFLKALFEIYEKRFGIQITPVFYAQVADS